MKFLPPPTAAAASAAKNATGAGGGGSRRPHVPVEGANTLQSRATIRAVDLLCEGEILGLVNGSASIFIDGTPIRNSDGTLNFTGLNYDFNVGTPDQDVLDGFPGVESENAVNQELFQNDPVVQTLYNSAIDGVRVSIGFPRLVTVHSNGDTGVAEVRFNIETKLSLGAAWELQHEVVIRDKNTSPAELSFTVNLSGPGPFSVRVTRLTADSDSDKLSNTIVWKRYTELTRISQYYPHSALASLTATTDEFTGQINKREYDIYGRIVKVPTNYDPIARTYAGLWDGTFKNAWTDNGAWVVYDILTNRRFGLGAEISPDYLDATKWELYAVAQFNDELVPDGAGGMEPRFRCNGVIAKAVEAKRLLDHVLSNFHGALYYGGGAVVPYQDRPVDPTFLVSDSNVIDGEFVYKDLPFSERYSAVAMSFNDPDDRYKLGIELVVDDRLVEKYGYRQTDRVAMFCTSRSQAQRLARHFLFVQERESDVLEYRAGLEHALVPPGAVIRQSDSSVAGVRAEFRVVEYVPSRLYFSQVFLFDRVEGLKFPNTFLEQWSGNLAAVTLDPDAAGGDDAVAPVKYLIAGNDLTIFNTFTLVDDPTTVAAAAAAAQAAAEAADEPNPLENHWSQVIITPSENRLVLNMPVAVQNGIVVGRESTDPVFFAVRIIAPDGSEIRNYIDVESAFGIVQEVTHNFYLVPDGFWEQFEEGSTTAQFFITAFYVAQTTDTFEEGEENFQIHFATQDPPMLVVDDVVDDVLIASGVTVIWLLQSDGNTVSYEIDQRLGIVGATINLTGDLDEVPAAGALVLLQTNQVAQVLWRVRAVTEVDALEYRVVANRYSSSNYADAESETYIEEPSFSLIPRGDLAPPESVAIEDFLYQDRGQVRTALAISVEDAIAADPRAFYVRYEIKGPGDLRWLPLVVTEARTYDYRGIRIGLWQARAQFVDGTGGVKSPWVESLIFDALGKTAPPSAPEQVGVTVRPDTGLLITIEPIPDLDRDEYSIRHEAGGDVAAELPPDSEIYRGKMPEYLWSTAPAGMHVFAARAHDTSDSINGGSVAVNFGFEVLAPNAVGNVTLNFSGGLLLVDWSAVNVSTFAIAHYHLLFRNAAGDELLAVVVDSTEFSYQIIAPTTELAVTVQAVDIAGNMSAPAVYSIIIEPPENMRVNATVIDNTVQFRYNAARGSLPVATYELSRGANYDEAARFDNKAGTSTFTLVNELLGGDYVYWWVAVDTAGNKSAPYRVDARVSNPVDYVFFKRYSARENNWETVDDRVVSKTGTFVTPNNDLILPTNNDETFREHFVNNGYDTIEEAIEDGLELWIEPGSFGFYQITLDHGTMISSATISVTGVPELVVGEVSSTNPGFHYVIRYSADINEHGQLLNPTSVQNMNTLQGNNFRYVQVELAAIFFSGRGLYRMTDLVVTFSVREGSDSGVADVLATDAAGTLVPFNKTFLDATQPTVTPIGAAARLATVDFDDVPNPTEFRVYLYDLTGARVSGKIKWTTTGVVV